MSYINTNEQIENQESGVSGSLPLVLARGTGRRKEAIAQVKIITGTGQFIINGLSFTSYFQQNPRSVLSVEAPLQELQNLKHLENLPEPSSVQSLLKKPYVDQKTTVFQQSEKTEDTILEAPLSLEDSNNPLSNFDIIVKVRGGGLVGQSDAIKLAVAKAFCDLNPDVRKSLKDKRYLTQDSRIKERRKYGLKKARKAPQYHKR
uniref:Small ribosomal subunit protein uS9c n=1 Tax=Koshicola spirodelophila TaxID=1707787 RepID=A0A167MFW1_9CHLO|nr:ribosomal protein S9 [Koshicola spirodelophila]